MTWYGHHHVLLDLHHQSTGTIFLSPAPHHDLHQRVAIGVVVLLMLLLLKLHPSKIVNASASTNVSLKTTLWLLPVAVPSTCKSILSITTWSSHTSNISHHIVGHITSQAYPAKQVRRPLILLLHVLRGDQGYLVGSHLTYANTTTEIYELLFNLIQGPPRSNPIQLKLEKPSLASHLWAKGVTRNDETSLS